MAYKNKERQLEYQRAHYRRNKSQRIALNKKRRDEIRIFLNQLKSCGCKVCSEKDVVCLDFHHLDPSQKKINLSHVAPAGWAKERIMSEVRKCIVLCSNCHRKLEFGSLKIL